MMDDRERVMVERVREALDRGTTELSPAVRERLAAARREAVAVSERKAARSWRLTGIPRWFTASATATVAVAVIAVSIWLAVPHGNQINRPEDFEILTSQDRLDVYENLDFYHWLATTNPHR